MDARRRRQRHRHLTGHQTHIRTVRLRLAFPKVDIHRPFGIHLPGIWLPRPETMHARPSIPPLPGTRPSARRLIPRRPRRRVPPSHEPRARQRDRPCHPPHRAARQSPPGHSRRRTHLRRPPARCGCRRRMRGGAARPAQVGVPAEPPARIHRIPPDRALPGRPLPSPHLFQTAHRPRRPAARPARGGGSRVRRQQHHCRPRAPHLLRADPHLTALPPERLREHRHPLAAAGRLRIRCDLRWPSRQQTAHRHHRAAPDGTVGARHHLGLPEPVSVRTRRTVHPLHHLPRASTARPRRVPTRRRRP